MVAGAGAGGGLPGLLGLVGSSEHSHFEDVVVGAGVVVGLPGLLGLVGSSVSEPSLYVAIVVGAGGGGGLPLSLLYMHAYKIIGTSFLINCIQFENVPL